MIATRNPSVAKYEDRKKAQAKALLLGKTVYTIDDANASGQEFVDFKPFSEIVTWEDAFIDNPKKASKQFRRVLKMSYHAGVSDSVESIMAKKAEKLAKKKKKKVS